MKRGHNGTISVFCQYSLLLLYCTQRLTILLIVICGCILHFFQKLVVVHHPNWAIVLQLSCFDNLLYKYQFHWWEEAPFQRPSRRFVVGQTVCPILAVNLPSVQWASAAAVFLFIDFKVQLTLNFFLYYNVRSLFAVIVMVVCVCALIINGCNWFHSLFRAKLLSLLRQLLLFSGSLTRRSSPFYYVLASAEKSLSALFAVSFCRFSSFSSFSPFVRRMGRQMRNHQELIQKCCCWCLACSLGVAALTNCLHGFACTNFSLDGLAFFSSDKWLSNKVAPFLRSSNRIPVLKAQLSTTANSCTFRASFDKLPFGITFPNVPPFCFPERQAPFDSVHFLWFPSNWHTKWSHW